MACRRAPVRSIHATTLLLMLVLSACTTAPPRNVVPLSPAPPLPVSGATVYRVLPESSELRIRVYRGGALGKVGHNHVITTSDIAGVVYLQPRVTASGFKLEIPLQSLRVDSSAARRDAGADFESTVSDADRSGTRKNMLGPDVLAAPRYPVMTLRSIRIDGTAWYPRITVRVTLHGTSHDYVVPTAIVRAEGRLTAIGSLQLQQTDFGITPFSVLGGALQVRDTVSVSFKIVARIAKGD